MNEEKSLLNMTVNSSRNQTWEICNTYTGPSPARPGREVHHKLYSSMLLRFKFIDVQYLQVHVSSEIRM